jgi:hypothetical protein
MNVNVSIERLIFDGIDLPSHQHPAVQAAVSAELARLLAAGGLQPGLLTGGVRAFLPGNPIEITSQGGPDQLGQGIAQAVYGGIGR